MRCRRVLLALAVCVALLSLSSAALAKSTIRPRIGGALGIIPALHAQNVASGGPTAVTYHGGSVMAGGITIHTVFWDPNGYPANNENLIKKFVSDVSANAADPSPGTCSTTVCNAFTVLTQYAEGTKFGVVTPGKYAIAYDQTNPADAIDDTDPYPTTDNCQSPNDTEVCLTDAQIQQEVDKVIQSQAPGNRGLKNLWYVFLPPGVDECILPGECGSNAYVGYHSLFTSNHGLAIYAVGIDPFIEVGGLPPGQDPEGNPDGEVMTDVVAHETIEAMTDPEGVGWMDPNGFEVGDKCEFGPQRGTPIGTASDGSPYNQVINGDRWLIQEMWSNDDNSGTGNGGTGQCVQTTAQTSNPLPLPQVNLTQFSKTVSGNTNAGTGGTIVTVSLVRPDEFGFADTVALGSTTSASDGSWSVTLQHPIGDDRDEIDIDYSGPRAPSPGHQVILTGNGGNPFLEAGWIGWTGLDNGNELTNGPPASLTMGPCFQTGVEAVFRNGANIGTSPTDFCNTQTDTGAVDTTPITSADSFAVSSDDNRAFQGPDLLGLGGTPNPTGGLVTLKVPVGEPDSASTFTNPPSSFINAPSGFPTCTADLQAQSVTCGGLVPGDTYTVRDGAGSSSGDADFTGTMAVPLPVHGGDLVSLSNGSRTLTTLHVAHLRVDITGAQTILSSGSCEPEQYYGRPLSSAPTNSSAGDPTLPTGDPTSPFDGVALTGEICPANGDGTGLPATDIAQTDESSQGATQTEVPDVEDTSPMEGETVYGSFIALAESGLPGPDNSVIPDTTSRVALTIRRSSGGRAIHVPGNLDSANGIRVKGLAPGAFTATWRLTDVNGDTRTVTTRFIEQRALRGARPGQGSRPKVACKLTGRHHHKVACQVTFRRRKAGTVRMRITRNGHVYALGHGRIRHGTAVLTMRELRPMSRGRWTATLVASGAHEKTQTFTETIRLR